MNEKRLRIAERYIRAFKQTAVIKYLGPQRNTKSSWHLFVIKIKNRDELMEQLKAAGIGSSMHFIPVHHHPYYQKHYQYNAQDFPIANKMFKESVSLPIFPDLSMEDVDRIIATVLKHVDDL